MRTRKDGVLTALVTLIMAGCSGECSAILALETQPGFTGIVCLAKFTELSETGCSITVTILNPLNVAFDMGQIVESEPPLCQVFLRVDGQLVEPKTAVQDVWPYSESIRIFDMKERKHLIIPATSSKDVLTRKVSWSPVAHEIVVWAQVFLPTSGSKTVHRRGATGPVLTSNSLLMRQ